jgi:CRISPR type IV-associated protein Csf3
MLDSLINFTLLKEYTQFFFSRDEKIKQKVEAVKNEIPIEKEDFGKDYFYKCSNPIYNIENEWIEHWSKKLLTHKIVLKVETLKKSVHKTSGAYKPYYSAMRCMDIKIIKYFAVGDKDKLNFILNNKIFSLGKKSAYGYGFVAFWEVNEIDKDYSVCYENMLLKTVPVDYLKVRHPEVTDYHYGYGRYRFPYFKGELSEILIPSWEAIHA